MKIFCSGIGGIGLSAYASLQCHAGHTVYGSDRAESPLIDDLRSMGIQVHIGQNADGIPPECDLYVYSEAIPTDAPERSAARERGIRSLSYFAALGELLQGKNVVAVCGTHGKSSTTAMAARMLMECGMNPSVVVGTKMRELDGKNWRAGSDLFVVEACEYRRSFHSIHPSVVLMISVDGDHFDAYPTTEEYQQAYIDFLRLLPKSGSVITHGHDPDCVAVVEQSGKTLIDADTQPLLSLRTPGLHMRQNAQLVLALAEQMGIDAAKAAASLAGFEGTWRRMELRGTRNDGVIVIDDYAHHPAEIRATLSAMREQYPDRRIVCVFQPHTHDRTIRLYDDFIASFCDADCVLIPGVYDARSDIETASVDVADFAADIARSSATMCKKVDGLDAAARELDALLEPEDVLITMGAGDITTLAGVMLSR